MDKPFHLMTPAERTALRISQNRAIDEKVALRPAPVGRSKASKQPEPPVSGAGTRMTPEERATKHVNGVIRKVQG
jgi:hypothetical protein